MPINKLENYGVILKQLKEKIKTAQTKAVQAVNNELLKVYWEIGKIISEQEQLSGWGSKVVVRLANDLKMEFPTMNGLSPRNLRYMREFSLAYPNFPILQQVVAKLELTDSQNDINLLQAVAKLPWGHHQILLDKVKNNEERHFYIQKCAEVGWSRNMMLNQLESNLYGRQGSLTSNFKSTLLEHQSELTKQLFKDPYNLDFIYLSEEAKERELEEALTTHITKLLLELGEGFAFMGKQKRLEVAGKEFFIDLLFYHTKLRRYIVIELKIGEFEPEFVGKMNTYLSLADDQLKGEFDQPSIGLILCKTKNKIIAEYALRDTTKPIGIAEYKINQILPEDIKSELPSIEDIEFKLDEEINENLSPLDIRLKTIKEKIKSLQAEPLQINVTNDILSKLCIETLIPFYEKIIQKFNTEFAPEFVSAFYNWQHGGESSNKINEFKEYLNTHQLKGLSNIEFNYVLQGFKKAGTENYGETLTLKFLIDTSWYGFSIVNHNNHKPLLKKLYHQEFTIADQQLIIDTLITKVLDKMELIIDWIEKKED